MKAYYKNPLRACPVGAGVVDSLATIAHRCVLYVWYDNEFGYSCQVVRMVQKMAGVELPVLPC